MNPPSQLWYLENFNLLKALTAEEKQALHEKAFAHEIPEGSQLVLTGELAHSLFLLKEGRLKISRFAPDGRELIISFLEEGEVFGELCLVGESNSGENVTALKKSVVCKIHKDDVRVILDRNAAFSLEVTKLIGQQLVKFRNRLESLYFKSAEERIRTCLRELASDYGNQTAPGEPVIISFSLKHADIARLSATNRQKVCTVLNDLEKQGYIRYDRKSLTIFNLLAL